MTITIGSWVLPLIVTVGLVTWALSTVPKQGGDYSFDIAPLFRLAAAIIGSLASWLFWSLFT